MIWCCLLLVVFFVAHLKWVFLKLMLLRKYQAIVHQVDETGLSVAVFTHCIVKVKALSVSEATNEYIIEVAVDMRVIRSVFCKDCTTWRLTDSRALRQDFLLRGGRLSARCSNRFLGGSSISDLFFKLLNVNRLSRCHSRSRLGLFS